MSRKVSNELTNPDAARPRAGLHHGPGALLLASTLLLPVAAGAAIFTVSSTNDSGAGSLRKAITDAEAAAGADEIRFNLGASCSTTGR